MIERAELSALAKSVRSVMRDMLGAVSQRLDALEKRFAEIPAGPRGEKGDKGDPGEQGPPGTTGPHGKDGAIGPEGPPGPVGPKGDPGEQGLSIIGERGIDGKDGKDGRDGRDGLNGKDGRDGIDGKEGRDALQLEILPEIDPAKSYPRGTYARHAGGILRAVENTRPVENGIAGWECIIQGIDAVQVTQGADLRTFTVRVCMTDAQTIPQVTTFTVPALIYREIFKDGTEYVRGDVVTYDNSAWHCQAESTKAKPGVSPDWKLMVRKGGNGRDGKDGKPGDRGPEGPRGRDLTQMSTDGSKW